MPAKLTPHLEDKIKRLLSLRNGPALRRLLDKHNFADIAEVMEDSMSMDELVTCFQLLSVEQAANVLTSLHPDRQAACLESLPSSISSQILRYMPSDDAVDILQDLDSLQSQKILEEMPFDTDTRSIHTLMREAPDTAAGVMSTDFMEIHAEKTVGDTLEVLRQAEEKDFIYYCYVVDAQRKLLGAVSLKQLLIQKPDVAIQDVAHFDIKSVLASDDQEEVVNLFRKYYNLLAIPVVDAENVLRGIITLDDVVDIIDEESSEDIYLSSGISIEAADEKHLLTGPVIKAVQARMPWLMVTLVGQFLAAGIIASFHTTVSAAVIAISFMPLLSGLSGNMGTQSETITVRGLALNLITDENFWGKLVRELKVGLITGITFSVSVGLLSYIQYQHWRLSLLLFVAIIVSLCTSALLGMLIPYGFERIFKQDPAGVGGPMITTLLDILTFTGYLYVLSLFLGKMI